jgi:hypothetical protein
MNFSFNDMGTEAKELVMDKTVTREGGSKPEIIKTDNLDHTSETERIQAIIDSDKKEDMSVPLFRFREKYVPFLKTFIFATIEAAKELRLNDNGIKYGPILNYIKIMDRNDVEHLINLALMRNKEAMAQEEKKLDFEVITCFYEKKLRVKYNIAEDVIVTVETHEEYAKEKELIDKTFDAFVNEIMELVGVKDLDGVPLIKFCSWVMRKSVGTDDFGTGHALVLYYEHKIDYSNDKRSQEMYDLFAEEFSKEEINTQSSEGLFGFKSKKEKDAEAKEVIIKEITDTFNKEIRPELEKIYEKEYPAYAKFVSLVNKLIPKISHLEHVTKCELDVVMNKKEFIDGSCDVMLKSQILEGKLWNVQSQYSDSTYIVKFDKHVSGVMADNDDQSVFDEIDDLFKKEVTDKCDWNTAMHVSDTWEDAFSEDSSKKHTKIPKKLMDQINQLIKNLKGSEDYEQTNINEAIFSQEDDESGDEEGDSDDAGGDFGPSEDEEGEDDMGGGDDFGDDGGDDDGGDDGFGGGDEEGGDDGDGFGGSDDSDKDKKRPGQHPYAEINGQTKCANEIRELISQIERVLKALESINVKNLIVNQLIELKEVSKDLLKIVYVQPIEETLFRYAMYVKEFENLVSRLKKGLDK